MIRQGKYNYVRPIYKDNLDELYDLQAEPEELYNLAVRPEFHEVEQKMRALLAGELKERRARFSVC
ncbi:MAG: hypothetical protein AAGJ83_02745 [Planctomycetota bacterium]